MQLLPIQGTYKVLQEVEKLRSQLVLSQEEVEGLSIISISSCVACSSSNAEMAEECQHYWSVRLDCQQALPRGGLKSQDYHFGKTLKEEMKKVLLKGQCYRCRGRMVQTGTVAWMKEEEDRLVFPTKETVISEEILKVILAKEDIASGQQRHSALERKLKK